MQRDGALRLLRERRQQLHALGVGQLFLYGSVARNEAREDSDVDRTILGTTADIHDYDGLRRLPEFRRRVSGDLVRVF